MCVKDAFEYLKLALFYIDGDSECKAGDFLYHWH